MNVATVPYRRLLGKADFYGIDGCLNRWIEAFLVDRKQSVLVDGVRSEEVVWTQEYLRAQSWARSYFFSISTSFHLSLTLALVVDSSQMTASYTALLTHWKTNCSYSGIY